MRGTRDGLICPWRVIDDCGSGFQMGTIGGSIFYFLRGKAKGFMEHVNAYFYNKLLYMINAMS
jgi:hypothetical protein